MTRPHNYLPVNDVRAGRYCANSNIVNWQIIMGPGHYFLLRIDYRINAPGWYDGGLVTLSFAGGESETVSTTGYIDGRLQVERPSPFIQSTISYTVRLLAYDGPNWCDYTVTRTVTFT